MCTGTKNHKLVKAYFELISCLASFDLLSDNNIEEICEQLYIFFNLFNNNLFLVNNPLDILNQLPKEGTAPPVNKAHIDYSIYPIEPIKIIQIIVFIITNSQIKFKTLGSFLSLLLFLIMFDDEQVRLAAISALNQSISILASNHFYSNQLQTFILDICNIIHQNEPTWLKNEVQVLYPTCIHIFETITYNYFHYLLEVEALKKILLDQLLPTLLHIFSILVHHLNEMKEISSVFIGEFYKMLVRIFKIQLLVFKNLGEDVLPFIKVLICKMSDILIKKNFYFLKVLMIQMMIELLRENDIILMKIENMKQLTLDIASSCYFYLNDEFEKVGQLEEKLKISHGIQAAIKLKKQVSISSTQSSLSVNYQDTLWNALSFYNANRHKISLSERYQPVEEYLSSNYFNNLTGVKEFNTESFQSVEIYNRHKFVAFEFIYLMELLKSFIHLVEKLNIDINILIKCIFNSLHLLYNKIPEDYKPLLDIVMESLSMSVVICMRIKNNKVENTFYSTFINSIANVYLVDTTKIKPFSRNEVTGSFALNYKKHIVILALMDICGQHPEIMVDKDNIIIIETLIFLFMQLNWAASIKLFAIYHQIESVNNLSFPGISTQNKQVIRTIMEDPKTQFPDHLYFEKENYFFQNYGNSYNKLLKSFDNLHVDEVIFNKVIKNLLEYLIFSLEKDHSSKSMKRYCLLGIIVDILLTHIEYFDSISIELIKRLLFIDCNDPIMYNYCCTLFSMVLCSYLTSKKTISYDYLLILIILIEKRGMSACKNILPCIEYFINFLDDAKFNRIYDILKLLQVILNQYSNYKEISQYKILFCEGNIDESSIDTVKEVIFERIFFALHDLMNNHFLSVKQEVGLIEFINILVYFVIGSIDVNKSLTIIGFLMNIGDYIKATNRELFKHLLLMTSYLCYDTRISVRKCAVQTLLSIIRVSKSDEKFENNFYYEIFTTIFAQVIHRLSSCLIYFSSMVMSRTSSSSEPIKNLIVHHSRNTVKKQWLETLITYIQQLTDLLLNFLSLELFSDIQVDEENILVFYLDLLYNNLKYYNNYFKSDISVFQNDEKNELYGNFLLNFNKLLSSIDSMSISKYKENIQFWNRCWVVWKNLYFFELYYMHLNLIININTDELKFKYLSNILIQIVMYIKFDYEKDCEIILSFLTLMINSVPVSIFKLQNIYATNLDCKVSGLRQYYVNFYELLKRLHSKFLKEDETRNLTMCFFTTDFSLTLTNEIYFVFIYTPLKNILCNINYIPNISLNFDKMNNGENLFGIPEDKIWTFSNKTLKELEIKGEKELELSQLELVCPLLMTLISENVEKQISLCNKTLYLEMIFLIIKKSLKYKTEFKFKNNWKISFKIMLKLVDAYLNNMECIENFKESLEIIMKIFSNYLFKNKICTRAEKDKSMDLELQTNVTEELLNDIELIQFICTRLIPTVTEMPMELLINYINLLIKGIGSIRENILRQEFSEECFKGLLSLSLHFFSSEITNRGFLVSEKVLEKLVSYCTEMILEVSADIKCHEKDIKKCQNNFSFLYVIIKYVKNIVIKLKYLMVTYGSTLNIDTKSFIINQSLLIYSVMVKSILIDSDKIREMVYDILNEYGYFIESNY